MPIIKKCFQTKEYNVADTTDFSKMETKNPSSNTFVYYPSFKGYRFDLRTTAKVANKTDTEILTLKFRTPLF